MKVTYNWLKDFVDIDVSPKELADKLTAAGMEVEQLTFQNAALHDVVVCKIEKIEKHPSADKLQVCQVNIGERKVQIITAATNIFEGAVVPVALPGADLANGVHIEKSKLRGVDSEGMFCSGEELGIDDSFMEGASIDGILILPVHFKIGQKIEEALELDDAVFEINITPNRPDCMSVVGIAREVCAILNKPFREPELSFISLGERASNFVDVELKSKFCSRYMAAVIKNVKIEKSPLSIRKRLHAVGIKSINTFVDLTNYVLVEMGQPLHAFDKRKIEGKSIIVRDGVKGEKLDALNHNSYELDEDVLVIADSSKPLVIAGVIGGTQSCVTNETKEVVIESAVFDLKSIRLTGKRFGVRTDSSARYSKGVYFASAEGGLKRLLHLVSKLGLGDILGGVIDKRAGKPFSRTVKSSVKEINEILGTNIPAKDISQILCSLGILTTIENGQLTASVPDFREDIENGHDLAEEVVRIYGYDVYEKTDARPYEGWTLTEGDLGERIILERKFKNALRFNGFSEACNYSFTPPDACEKLQITDNRRFMLRIANPLGEEVSFMRTSMAYAAFTSLAYNFSVGNKKVRLFELGRTYHPAALPVSQLPEEQNHLSMFAYDMDFCEFKACVEAVLSESGLRGHLVRSKESFLHPGRAADVVDAEGNIYASFGQVHPTVAKNFDIPKSSLYADILIDKLLPKSEKRFELKPVPRFPVVERDIAIIVKEGIANADLMSAIKSACGKLFYDARMFDIYRSETLGEGMKSMAYNIRLSDENKTLTDEEVTEVIGRVLKALKFRYGASLR